VNVLVNEFSEAVVGGAGLFTYHHFPSWFALCSRIVIVVADVGVGGLICRCLDFDCVGGLFCRFLGLVMVVFFASALAVVLSSLLVVLGLQERVSLSLAGGDGSCAGPEIQERPV
jgi:hypothetical protein